MKKTMARLGAVCIVIIMIVSLLPQISFGVTWQYEETAPAFEQVLYQKDGTNTENMSGQYWIAKDEEKGECYAVGNAPYVRQLFFNVPDNQPDGTKYVNEEGQALISFDICAPQTDRGIVLIINDTNGRGWSPFMLTGGGKMQTNENRMYPSAKSLYSGARDYEANRWYNIKLAIYTHEQYIDFYVDNVFWKRHDIAGSYWMNNLYQEDLTLKEVFFNYQPDWGLDKNGNQLPADSSGSILIDNFMYGIPQKRETEIDFWKTEEGNIYDCEDVNVGCDVINRSEKDEKFTLTYDIRTDKNKAVKKESLTIEVKAGERKSVEMLDYAPEYGFYSIEAELYNSDGGIVVRDTTRFSIIAHQNGVNEAMGVTVHNVGHGDSAYGATEDTLAVAEKLGISSVRDDYPWASFYAADGETRTNDAFMQKNNERFNNTPIDRLVIVRTMSEAYSMKYDENSETVKSFLDRWGKYCYNLAKDLGENTIYYEIENEWWLHGSEQAGEYYNINWSSDVKLYAEMYKIASKQIKLANPNAKIVAFNHSHGNYEWLRAVLDALGENPGQYFDIIAFHDYMTYWAAQYPEQFMQSGDPSRGGGQGGMDLWFELVKEYGLEDKPLWSSEFGTTSGYHKYDVSEKMNADYYVRHFMFDTQYMERMYIYQLQLDEWEVSAYEGGFGIIREGARGEILREALPAAIELAAYNSLLKDSEVVSSQEIIVNGKVVNSKDTYIYKHKMSDGKDCYAIFNATGEKNMSFDFGVESADVYDEYGNKTTISALDGYITLKVTTAPQYVVAPDLIDEVKVREKPIFDMTADVTTAVNDAFNFEITKDSSRDIAIEIQGSANMEIPSNLRFVRNVANIDVSTRNDVREIENYEFYFGNIEQVEVTLCNDSKIYYKAPLAVKYTVPLETDLRIMPYRSGRWQAVLSLKNNKRTSPLWGQIDISTGDKEEIENLLAGQKSTIRFNIPENVSKNNYEVKAQIILEDGSVITDSATTNFISVEKVYSPPILDGKIDLGEYRSSGNLISFADEEQYIRLNPLTSPYWKESEDLSGKMYLMYDDSYLYLAAEVTDDIHCGKDEQNRVWAMDSIQFGVAESQTKASNYAEIGIALLDSGEVKIEKYADPNMNDPYYDKKSMNIFDEDTELKVERNGNKTVYELKIPWLELTVSGKRPAEQLVFSALINEHDGKGRQSYMQWASGIGSGKNPELYAVIPFNS